MWDYDPIGNPQTSANPITERNIAHFLLQNRENIDWRGNQLAPFLKQHLSRPGVVNPLDFSDEAGNALKAGDVRALVKALRDRIPGVWREQFQEAFDPQILTPSALTKLKNTKAREGLYTANLTPELGQEFESYAALQKLRGRGGMGGGNSGQEAIVKDFLTFLAGKNKGLANINDEALLAEFGKGRRAAGLQPLESLPPHHASALRQYQQWRGLNESDPENVFNLRGGGTAKALEKLDVNALETVIKGLTAKEATGKLTANEAAKLRQAQNLYVLAAGKVGLPVAADVRAQRLTHYGKKAAPKVQAESYEEFLKQRYAQTPRTAQEQMRITNNMLGDIARQLGKKNVSPKDLTASEVNRWIVNRLTGRGGERVTGQTLNKGIQAVHNYVEFAKSKGLLPENYSLEGKIYSTSREAVKVQASLSPQDVKKIKDVFVGKHAGTSLAHEVKSLAYDVLTETAKRAGAEMQDLKVKDLRGNVLRVVQLGKKQGKVSQSIKLTDELASRLNEFVRKNKLQGDDPLIPSAASLAAMQLGRGQLRPYGAQVMRTDFKEAARAAGYADASLHNLRAATTTEATKQGGLGLGRRMAAHSGPRTTATYVNAFKHENASNLMPVLIEQRMVDEFNAIAQGKDKQLVAELTGKPIKRTRPKLPEGIVPGEAVAFGIKAEDVVKKMMPQVNRLIVDRIKNVLPPALRAKMGTGVKDRLTRLKAAYESKETLGKQAPLSPAEFKKLKIAWANAVDTLIAEAREMKVRKTMKGDE